MRHLRQLACVLLLAAVAMACREASVEVQGDGEVDTDTFLVIMGRDSLHQVPDDVSTSQIDSSTMATDEPNTDSGTSDTVADSETAGQDSATTGTDTATADMDSVGTGVDSATVEHDSQTTGQDFGSDADSASDTDTDSGDAVDSETGAVLPTDLPTDAETDTGTETQGTPGNRWTIMLYMAADSNLEGDMMQDLSELAAVNAPEWLNILVLFDRHQLYDTSDGNWTGTRLFRVNPSVASGLERLSDADYLGLTNSGDTDELDMGDGDTLDQFIQFAIASYPSENYALVLSGHGNGWMKKGIGTPAYQPKVICSDDSGNQEGMSVQQVLAPLLKFYEIDVLGFDACLMGMIEVAWAVRRDVKYVVASEANEISTGWDYLTWFSEWIKSSDFSAQSLVQKQLVAYRRHYSSTDQPWQLTMSVVDTRMLDALGDAINQLVADHPNRNFVTNAMTFDVDYDYYYDLWDIAELAGDDELKAALEAAVIHNWYSNGSTTPGGLSIMFIDPFPESYLQTPFCVELDWC